MSYHLTHVRMAIIKKSTNNRCWWEYGEKGKHVHCWWECKLVQPPLRTVGKFLKNRKTELPYDLAISLLGIYLKKMRTLIWKDTCTPMFIVELFARAKILKQPKCPSTDEWIKKCTQWNISHKKEMKLCHLKQSGWTYSRGTQPPGCGLVLVQGLLGTGPHSTRWVASEWSYICRSLLLPIAHITTWTIARITTWTIPSLTHRLIRGKTVFHDT